MAELRKLCVLADLVFLVYQHVVAVGRRSETVHHGLRAHGSSAIPDTRHHLLELFGHIFDFKLRNGTINEISDRVRLLTNVRVDMTPLVSTVGQEVLRCLLKHWLACSHVAAQCVQMTRLLKRIPSIGRAVKVVIVGKLRVEQPPSVWHSLYLEVDRFPQSSRIETEHIVRDLKTDSLFGPPRLVMPQLILRIQKRKHCLPSQHSSVSLIPLASEVFAAIFSF